MGGLGWDGEGGLKREGVWRRSGTRRHSGTLGGRSWGELFRREVVGGSF